MLKPSSGETFHGCAEEPVGMVLPLQDVRWARYFLHTLIFPQLADFSWALFGYNSDSAFIVRRMICTVHKGRKGGISTGSPDTRKS